MRLLIAAAMALVGTVLAGGGGVRAESLPVPPIPPERLTLSEAAPVPNQNVRAPAVPTSEDPSVDVTDFRSRQYDPASGFAPGSRYQSNEDRRAIQTPGLTVIVPFK